MRKFYLLAIDPNRDDLQSLQQHEIEDYSHVNPFWKGTPIDELPSSFRFIVSDKTPSDLLGNPLELTIVSERVLEKITKWVSEVDYQIFDPIIINSKTQKHVSGYKLFHCLKTLKALDSEHCDTNKLISNRLVISEKCVPSDVHLFRLSEEPLWLIFSEELFNELNGKGLQGMAAIHTKTVP